MLSPNQFRGFAQNIVEQGGDSLSLTTGERPTTGFMVARQGAEQRIATEDASARRVVQYARTQKAALSQPQAYLGAWASGRTTFLDVSDRFHDRRPALQAGWHRKQIAIYDRGQSKDVYVTQSLQRSRRLQRKMAGAR